MELYEQIRREYEFGAGSIIGVAQKLGVHRRTVREAVRSALPARRKKTVRPHLKIAPATAFIDAVLEADRKAPRKQRHTAKRIWERIRLEVPGCTAAERTVRQYVERRKQEQGLGRRETFVPQSYEFGVEVQIDWYEAYADLDGEQAFLEAHELAFHYFGGVFRKLRYDNLTSAVKKILRGYEREMTARFIAFRSHWQYEASFCTPGEGHEKGGVEGEVGYFRRNHWVPVPVARDLADLNAKLFADCRQDENRMVAGRTQSVGALLLIEKEHLLPLPLKPGTVVEARVYSSVIEFRQSGVRIAQHERSYDRARQILDLEHYLDVLERKPGALRGSKPLAEWRAQGRWPQSYDRLWELMAARQGRQAGARSMVAVIRMGREFGHAKLEASVAEALELGCTDVAAIRHLLMADQLQHVAQETIEIGVLAAYERPLPTMIEYNQLLSAGINGVQA